MAAAACLAGAAAALALSLAAATGAAEEVGQPITVPSGQPVTLAEVRWDQDDGPTILRLRFVSPDIARDTGRTSFETAVGDMAFLCETLALSLLSRTGRQADTIMISLADRPAEFGRADPEMTQYFEAYRPDDGTCMLEFF